MKTAKSARSQQASAIVDIVCVVVVLVPLSLLAVNFGYLCLGSFINDAACREAARAAAQQTSLTPALGAARAVVKSFAIAGGAISSPQVNGVFFNFQTDADGNPINVINLDSNNMTTAPNVQVVTQLVARTPAPMLLTANGLSQSVTLTNTCTFPILNGVDADPEGSEDDVGEDAEQPADPDDSAPPEDTQIDN